MREGTFSVAGPTSAVAGPTSEVVGPTVGVAGPTSAVVHFTDPGESSGAEEQIELSDLDGTAFIGGNGGKTAAGRSPCRICFVSQRTARRLRA